MVGVSPSSSLHAFLRWLLPCLPLLSLLFCRYHGNLSCLHRLCLIRGAWSFILPLLLSFSLCLPFSCRCYSSLVTL
ncbi:uncharacterized protein J3D65DRAFT_615035 [Phyllosticta citribraziliensis]|uniref:Secreted peptide n=1 Tax=Phyllosticta citribraziliensis TaxID=989973 RepID=A0ABR1M5E6_9PEZI